MDKKRIEELRKLQAEEERILREIEQELYESTLIDYETGVDDCG